MATTDRGATAAPGAGPFGRGLRVVLLTLSLALAGVVGLVLPYGALLLALGITVYLGVTGGRASFRLDAAAVLLLAAFLLLLIAHVLSARHPADILFALNFIYLLFFIPFISLYLRTPGRDPAGMVAMLALLGSLLMLLLGSIEMLVFAAPRVGYLTNDPIRYAGAALVLGFLSLVGLRQSSGRVGWWYLLGPLAALATVLMTGSRGAMVGYAVLAAVAVLMLSRRRLLPLLVLALLLAVGIAGVSFTGIGAARLTSMLEIARQLAAGETVTDIAFGVRLDLYQAGIRSFLESPLVGHGWSRLTEAPQQYVRTGISIPKHAHLHSDLLNFAVAGGSLGVLAYLLILIAPLVAALRSPRDRFFGVRLYGCVMLCLAYLILGSTSLMFGFEYPTALYVCTAALLLGFCRETAL